MLGVGVGGLLLLISALVNLKIVSDCQISGVKQVYIMAYMETYFL